MSENLIPDQMRETIQHLIEEKERTEDLKLLVAEQESEVEGIKEELEEAKTVLKSRKQDVEDGEARTLDLVDELARLNRGEQRLPLTPEPLATSDPAEGHSLDKLMQFGLTAAEIEKLQESQLVETRDINSVAGLLKAISEDCWWFKKIKGFGEKKVDKLTAEVIPAYRAKHPMPDEIEVRQKKCGAKVCGSEYTADQVVCPDCGSTLFEFIDEPESPADQSEDIDSTDDDALDPDQPFEVFDGEEAEEPEAVAAT